MIERKTFYSIGHASKAACEAAVAATLSAAAQPDAIHIYGPFQIVGIVAPGDPDAAPPVPAETASDGFWRFNALSRGEALSGDWIDPPATPSQIWS
jgi:hypothetical protein